MSGRVAEDVTYKSESIPLQREHGHIFQTQMNSHKVGLLFCRCNQYSIEVNV